MIIIIISYAIDIIFCHSDGLILAAKK